MSQNETAPAARLTAELGHLAETYGLPSLVVADQAGLLVAAADGAAEVDEVAALSALRAVGDGRRPEVASGRVKAREIPVGGEVLVVGALGDTNVCAAVFDRAERAVKGLVN